MKKSALWLMAVIMIGALGLMFYIYHQNSPVSPEMNKYADDWPAANRDYANTRATTSSSIDSSSISNLKPAWSLPINGVGQWGAAASNPLILGSTVYFQDLKSNVYAVDLKTGSLLWKKEYNLDTYGPNGPAVGRQKIFVVKGHYQIAALDLDGNELWSTTLSEKNVGIDIQPLEYDQMVYVSTVPGTENADFYSGGGIGVIYALDQKTGSIKWSFDTVDSKDIWGNPAINSGGGSWFPPAVDTENHDLFWGVGNPGPWPGTKDHPNGSSRPGPNLYTDSLLKLNHRDGTLQWFSQVIAHDLFDYDFHLSPVLASITHLGERKDAVIGAGKMGRVYAFDRVTGKILWETAVGQHQNDTLKSLPEGVTRVIPGPLGGVETPIAYQEGIIYVPVVNLAADYTPTGINPDTFDIGSGTGELVALDANNNGKVIWQQKFGSIDVGGATVVNDLVFTSTFDGTIYAFNRLTGEKLWEYKAPGGINGWPAVAQDTIIFPVGLGQQPLLIAFNLK
ncbi:MAG: PQQ-binding-like beta-propeller repeat protein [Firmicutes bacterium]|nr:PQQ-binding-like beta-propeller repeat protein [Bacillota bacterium]